MVSGLIPFVLGPPSRGLGVLAMLMCPLGVIGYELLRQSIMQVGVIN